MPTETVSYIEAIGEALRSEMDANSDVFLIGEDVGQFGGAFKATKGFLDRFGPQRVVDAPIAESGFTGLACGAALMGLRPVVEFQFADFISCAFDQIINNCSRHHYRTGNPIPVTFRAPFGARLRAGPTHSQSVEAYFGHVPGLKIVAPATPQDAAGLLISAIRDNNPVLYLESKYLYRRLEAPAPLALDPVPIGSAKVVRAGTQVSLLTYSVGVHQGLEAAAVLAGDGISVEVVDLRTLVPLDIATIAASVNKTSRAVVLHEDARRLGAPPITAAPSVTAASPAAAVTTGPRDQAEPLSRMRLVIGERMIESLRIAPHVWTSVEVDMQAIEEVRRRHKERFRQEEGTSLTYLPFIARATCDALRAFPVVNASLDMSAKTRILHHYVNLGIAVDLAEQGLVVPVIRNADGLNVRGLARAIRAVADKATSGTFTHDDLAGSTFTITNPGPAGDYASAPIINQPNSAILSTNVVSPRPTAVGDAVAVHHMTILGFSYDHRAFDGVTGSRFLAFIRDALQDRDWAAELG